MATNDYLLFATAAGANVITQSQYASLPALGTGFEEGTAYSDECNKVWRQASMGVTALATFVVNQIGVDMLDDGNVSTFVTNFKNATLNLVGTASTSAAGRIQLATNAEAAAGTNTTKAIVPSSLASVLASYAPLASPALTGTPTAPTQAVTDNSTKLASTAFVWLALSQSLRTIAATGSTRTFLSGDKGALIQRSNSGAVMIDTLPGTGSGVLPDRWQATIYNFDTAALLCVTVGSGATLDGVVNGRVYLGPFQSCILVSDGSNYYSLAKPALTTLQANATLYVSPSGNDSAPGLTSGTPLATIQAAFNLLLNFNLNNLSMTIQLADGTYTEALNISGAIQGNAAGGIIINGNASFPANVVITCDNTNAITVANGEQLTVQNFTISTTTNGDCIMASHNSDVTLGNIIFGACADAHIHSRSASVINVNANYTISGNAKYHMHVSRQGYIFSGSDTVVLSGTRAFTDFVLSEASGVIDVEGTVYSGTATGKRYVAQTNGVISTGTGNPNFFPGNSAGTTTSGGQYT